MPNPIVDLVQEEMDQFERDRASYRELFPPPHIAPVIYPIPFFGDIRKADVLTMTLNPSWKEFVPERKWLAGLDAGALTTRLLNYFNLPWPKPHPFFGYRQPMLTAIARSYRDTAAHVDLVSAPTLRPRADGMGPEQRQSFAKLVEQSTERLQRVLTLSCMTKIILIWDLKVNDGNGAQWSVWERAVARVPLFQKHCKGNGKVPPIIRAGDPDELAQLVDSRHDEIREYLGNGPRLCHANYD